MCGNRTHTTGLKIMAFQSVAVNTPSAPWLNPTGACIQLLFTMIQNDDRLVPTATMRHDRA